MKHKILIALPLALAGVAYAATSDVPPRAVALDELTALTEEYEDSVDTWRALVREAEGIDARKELRANHPAKEYWPRFEALAAAGEGRAFLWMADNLSEKGHRIKEARAENARLLRLLVKDYLKAEWFGDVLSRVSRERWASRSRRAVPSTRSS